MEFTLHCGDTTARVRQKGAQMTSFKGNDNREVIWQADPAVWRNHAPVLFPICGTAKDNHVIIDGVSYPIAKHGASPVTQSLRSRKSATTSLSWF